MKVPIIISKIFTNKYFLYLMVFLAFTNIIGYIILGNINAVIYFILIGILIAFFSKNMSLILLVALIFTNLIVVNNYSTKEGLENNTPNKNIVNNNNNTISEPNKEENKKPSNSPDVVPLEQENFRSKQKLSGSKVDYASTIEHAYDNLNKILGSDGIKNLTDDTHRLMQQQQKLAESMQSMTPLIQNITPLLNQTKDMLGNMNIENIDQIASLITNFTGNNK
jgi:hypothetical protein